MTTVPVMAIHVGVGRHPNISRYNDAASSPDERRPVRLSPIPAWRNARRDIRGVHPHIASDCAFGGLAGSCGLRERHWELLGRDRGRLCRICRSLPLCFDEGTETRNRLVPLRRDLIQITANVREALGPELPNTLAAGPSATHQSGALKSAQMFRNGLTGNVGTFR
jgi:hypothetical protein